ncbi:hypothetical protein D3C73_1585790 [compost metagenome]
MNSARETTPAAIGTITSALDQPLLPAWLKPNSNAPKPIVERITLRISILVATFPDTFLR